MSNANHPLPKKITKWNFEKGIGGISGVGGMSLHGMNELDVSLYVDIFDSSFFFLNFNEIVVIYAGILFVIQMTINQSF